MRRLLVIVSVLLAVAGTVIAQEHNVKGPGRVELDLKAGPVDVVGRVIVHNKNRGLVVNVETFDGWYMDELHIHPGWVGNPIPTTKKGSPIPGHFQQNYEYDDPVIFQSTTFDFEADLEDFRWGQWWEDQRVRRMAVHANVIRRDGNGNTWEGRGAWAGDLEFAWGNNYARWFQYEMCHKGKAHFIDSPVEGLRVVTPTEDTYTDESGGVDYFPSEHASFYAGDQYLGTTLLDHKVSPLDLFPMSDIDDSRVANMAKLLQSLDADAEPKQGITITPDVEACFNAALATYGFITDWSYDAYIDHLVADTIYRCAGVVDLVEVSREEAVANLDRSLNSNMFRKNISRTPDRASAKAKLNVMRAWFPAVKANGDTATFLGEDEQVIEGVPYYDAEGELLRVESAAKPLVITYTDRDEETDAHDVWVGISRDDGHSFKKKNISRAAYRSSFDVDGVPFYGHAKKPVFQVQGNKILVAWTSKYCRGGKPAYSIDVCPDDDGDGVPDPCFVCKGNPDDPNCDLDYVHDDPYWQDDIWGVAGPQRSHDYTDDGYPDVGLVPYSCVWTARGVIASQSDINKGVFDPLMYVDDMGTPDDLSDDTERGVVQGDIVWYKPERLTSGRRDANQIFMGGAEGAGFAIAWQEDPDGLRPGEAKGPGPGWGGATTNHKTDIWYSFIEWSDFDTIDANFVPGGDPEHDDPNFVGRPKALVPMSLPVRISDNDVVNTDNMWIELDAEGLPVQDDGGNFNPIPNPDTQSIEESYGSHRYGYLLDGLWNWDGQLQVDGEVDWNNDEGMGTLYEFINHQGDTKRVVVTADGRPLDGNTGASRPNLFLKTYTKPDGTKSAWAIMAYEETKGMGSGPPEDNGGGTQPQDGSGYDPYAMVPDEGKNAIYHSFDFTQPDLVSAGTILNLPETDDNGDPLFVVEPEYLGSDPIYDGEGNIIGYDPIPNPLFGDLILDWKGAPQLAYENARRPRFILQSKSGAFGGTKSDGSFKEPWNSGTVLIVLYKEGQEGQGRPSDIMARRCVVKDTEGNVVKGNPYAPKNFVPGVQNLSTVNPLETWVNPDRDPNAKGDGTKVCKWDQPEEILNWKSGVNPYEDARAHRGQIRGDFVVMGYSYTPNWASSRKAHDKYDFYMRRSFDGGETWTTDPDNLANIVHTDIFFDPDGISGAELDEDGNDISEPTKHYYVETIYAGGGIYEPARNVTLLKNNKISVIEPRIVAVPGTIKVAGEWTGLSEDKANNDVFYVAYGTSTNLPDVEKAPEDLFLSFSNDRGTTLFMDEWEVNPDSSGNWAGETKTGWYRLAKGDPEQGEVQLRMTPDGSRFYGSWLEEGDEGSDIVFRRIMPSEFDVNVAPTTTEAP